jgi:hypothetical protein
VRRALLGTAVLLAVCCLLGLPGAAPSYASCAESGPEGSDVIFVGTAREERRGYTRFEVDEVWAGPELAEQVWVLSGQEQGPFPLFLFSAVGSSNDAAFADGERYVVGATPDFRTGACSVAEADAIDSLRPDLTRGPVDGAATGADPPASWLRISAVSGGAALMVGGAVLSWRHRKHPERF